MKGKDKLKIENDKLNAELKALNGKPGFVCGPTIFMGFNFYDRDGNKTFSPSAEYFEWIKMNRPVCDITKNLLDGKQ